MAEAGLVFPHQLFAHSPVIDLGHPVYLVEEHLFFRQFRFHKQKLAFHRASMQFYKGYLAELGIPVHYIASMEPEADVHMLVPVLAGKGVRKLHVIDPVDDWLGRRLRKTADRHGVEIALYDTPMFLNTGKDLESFFKPSKKKFFQTKFYIEQRKMRGVLIDGENSPAGGKWSFDAENREKFPKGKKPPVVQFPGMDDRYSEALAYVDKHFPEAIGKSEVYPLYPADFRSSRKWLQDFLENRFAGFGPYEDAIVSNERILNHSVLTPMLNTGLLTPMEVVDAALEHASTHGIPINSLEGFIRQVIGWREFIRGIYVTKGREERTCNFWGFDREIPRSFYDGTTGIEPVDVTIRKVLDTGYCHHIERLMVLGNFMLLCEFDPDEVYRWFMELFIDAYDWVMVPNVYGMSQFADGGLMSTKPYISGSNYILKMSDFGKGPWQKTWDGLFWRYMHVHRDFFSSNPRLGMLLRSFDRMGEEKQRAHLEEAERYLVTIS
jgi:deoxyribodipyrimidine photolyase-related protein